MQYSTTSAHLRCSQLGFGCCPLGGHGWGDVDMIEAGYAVDKAVDHGVTLFDTADVYGLGESERRLGRSLGKRRKDVLIATKFGVRRAGAKTYHDNSMPWLDEALDASLRRLGTEWIDIYQVHYLDRKTPLDELIEALEAKRRAGKIRHYGFSNANEFLLDGVVAAASPGPASDQGLVSFQSEYSLLRREHESTIRDIQQKLTLLFFSWGSLAQGMLTGKYDGSTRFDERDRRNRAEYVSFHGARRDRSLRIVNAVREIARERQRTPAQVAIRWIVDHLGGGACVLTGIKSVKQLDDNLGAFGWTLMPSELARLHEATEPQNVVDEERPMAPPSVSHALSDT